MLYVFHVDMGRMLSFDMTVALSSVENLKSTIERLHGIPAANIVLLVSGGEMLSKSTQVSCYSAGTDTNPIYMFLTGDTKPPTAMVTALDATDADLREQVDRCLELPAVYETIVKRAQLALRMYDLARDEEKRCERLVHEQHLQQQGWSAVVANMEDLTNEFRQRFKNFCIAFDRHLENRETYLNLLQSFGDDLAKLSRIPILPALMPLAEEDFHGFDEYLDTDEMFARSQLQQVSVIGSGDNTTPNKKLKIGIEPIEEQVEDEEDEKDEESFSTIIDQRRSLTLLQWISAKENCNTLKLMSDECVQGLGTFNEDVYGKLKSEIQNIIKLAEQADVKDIKGLGERLCKLEEFKYKIKNMVQDQRELSTAFQQNQNRAINLRDVSILPDLCASHQSQLLVMLKNHQKIREYKFCITKAKDELGLNLHMRLKRIVWIENAMSDFDNRLLFYHRCLRRAERHINIIEQIHLAPSIYATAATEVVRRKIFSREFQKWASKLAHDFDAIHSEEMRRRHLFNARFEGHFLNILFPGMNDMPPSFATENPIIFDARLPNISRSDIKLLSTSLPDLQNDINLPDMAAVIQFFTSRSGEHRAEPAEHFNETNPKDEMQCNVVEEDAILISHQELKTDMDDDERIKRTLEAVTTVDASTSTYRVAEEEWITRSTATECCQMLNEETLTDENRETINADVIRFRNLMEALHELSMKCLKTARGNLAVLRADTERFQHNLLSELQSLNTECSSKMHDVNNENQSSECEELRKKLDEQNLELAALKAKLREKEAGELRYTLLEEEVEQTREQLKSFELEKECIIAEIRDKLINDHKTEIESLRCRFKLMSQSQADIGAEKPIALNDMMDIACHEMICAQIRSELNAAKEKEITAALETERSLWQSKIFPINSESVMANVNVLKDMLEEKEKQLDQFREKDLMLTKENYQLKARLDALTSEDGNSWLREKVAYLNRDKGRLEEELTIERSRRVEMESSVAELRSSIYEQACVVGSLPRSKCTNYGSRYIVVESCNKGDIVFAVWSARHGQFMVVQDSQSLYFVHSDSLGGLNLNVPVVPALEASTDERQQIPMPYYAIGRVIDKEYCQAKKDENRYRVARGTKFYRIKLAPLPVKHSIRRDRSEHFSVTRLVSHLESNIKVNPPNTLDNASRMPIISTSVGSAAGSANFNTRRANNDDDVASGTNLFKMAPDLCSLSQNIEKVEEICTIDGITSTAADTGSRVMEPPLMEEPCRSISVSEERMHQEIAAAVMPLQQSVQQQTVITEQPTSSTTNLKLDLVLGCSDLTRATNKTIFAPNTSSPSPSKSTVGTVGTIASGVHILTSSIPATYAKGEDSDEYRSLETKEESEILSE